MMMPGMTGAELHLRLNERDPKLADKVVFMTGGAFTPGVTSHLERVTNARIAKPFEPSRLRRLVAERVARKNTG